MHDLSRATLLGLAMLSAASTVSAVSLASFTPRINNLPPTCQSVYTTTIEGCRAEDFGSSNRCSSACVQGLAKITESVLRGCADVDVGETSIIGVFQNGLGIQALCPGVSVTTVGSTTATSTRSTTTVQSTSSRATTTTSTRASTTSDSASETQTSSATSAAIATDPGATSANNAPTGVTQSSTFRTSAAPPSRTANSQLSNADSGGGSPFDVTATGSSAQLRVVDVTATAFLATAFLFVVFV